MYLGYLKCYLGQSAILSMTVFTCNKAKIGNNPIGYNSCVLFQYGFIVGKATRRQRAKISIRDIHT